MRLYTVTGRSEGLWLRLKRGSVKRRVSEVLSMQIQRKSVAWLLVYSLVQLPLPWLHRHCDLEASKIAEHVEVCHPEGSEWELSDNWHIHWLFTSSGNPNDGLCHRPNPEQLATPRSDQYCFEEPSKCESVISLASPVQGIWSIVAEADSAEILTIDLCPNSFHWRSAITGNQRRAMLCVLQI